MAVILTHDSEPWSHVVGIDPGETTGLFAIQLAQSSRELRHRIARGRWHHGEVGVGETREAGRGASWWIQEARLQRNIVGRLRSLAASWEVAECLHVSIEDFILRERTKDRSLLSPVRMTSGILALLEEADDLNVVVHFNSTSDAKGTVTDVVLRRLGLYVPGMGHANDAARQAVITLRKELA